MRVAIHCPYSLSRPGGVQGQVLALARTLRARDHHAVVLAPGDEEAAALAASVGLDEEALVVLGRSVSLPANGSVAPVALWPGAAARAVRAVRNGAFDVVHLHEPLAPGPGYALLGLCREAKVGTFHRAGGSAAYRWLGPLARRAAARLAVRCAVSAEARATAHDALGGSYELVANAVETERFAGAEPWAPGDAAGPIVMFVGRHEERKGLGVLLEAFERVAPSASGGPTLWVAGRGPETDELRRRFGSSRRVVWLGAVPDAELASRLRRADVLCAPSLRGESFGVVLLEAMAARTAIVASALPGYEAVAGDDATLVAPGDAGALAEALGRAVSDAEQGTGTSSPAALDEAAARAGRWSTAAQADRYLCIYEHAVRKTTPSRSRS
ncbi:MAG TPA: glycosyltransferase family 4 protein [Acidimicrobiales bacterium]|nr:glycosyltransferase family 4 protein [Acidimicrobiales bacterium]